MSASATSSAISLLDDDDYVWRTIASDALQAERSAGLLLERGVRTAAILHRDEAWGNGIAEAFIEAFEDSEGRATGAMGGSAGASSTGEVFASVAYDVTGDSIRDLFAYDYREELTEVFAEMPEVLVVASFDEVSRIATRMILGGHLDVYGDEPPILWLV